MSVQGAKYQPSQDYILAALHLSDARIEEINSSASTIEHIEIHEEQGHLTKNF